MNILTLLSALKDARIHISVSGDKLLVKAPEGAMTQQISRAIKLQKDSLVDILGRVRAIDNQGVIQSMESGEHRVLPSQNWFLNVFEAEEIRSSDWVDVHEYKIDSSITEPEKLDKLIRFVLAYHDGLRSVVFKRSEPYIDGEVEQKWGVRVLDDFLDSIDIIDVAGMDTDSKRKRIAEHVASSVLKVSSLKHVLARFTIVADTSELRLIIVIHHLITDGSSNQILEAQLHTLLGQTLKHQQLNLPSKPDSVFRLADDIIEFFNSDQVRKEAIDYWNNLPLSTLKPISLKTSIRRNSPKTARLSVVPFKFSKGDTSAILDGVLKSDQLSMVEFISWAFTKAVFRSCGHSSLILSILTPGRTRPIVEGRPPLDLNRTFGWLTSCERYFLQLPSANSQRDELNKVAKQIRGTPHQGLSHDVVQSELKVNLGPEKNDYFRLNFLGSVASEDAGIRLLRPDLLYTEIKKREASELPLKVLMLKGIVADGSLILHPEYNTGILTVKEAQAILDSLKQEVFVLLKEQP
jgi:hypothetical protein